MSSLVMKTREIDPVGDLLVYADPSRPLAWLRRGDGIVAIGDRVVATVRVPAGENWPRAELVAAAWRRLTQGAEVHDPLALPGTGLVAFGALTFDEGSAADSVLIVPSAIIGRHRGRTWFTAISSRDAAPPAPTLEPRGYGPHWAGTLSPGTQTPQGYQEAVRQAMGSIAAGALSKVVIARDLTESIPAGSDLRRLVRALSTGYHDTWSFAVDGLIGASSEILVTVQTGTMTARVLAGTIGRGADPDADTTASASLVSSTKDLDEHQYAVQSVLTALRPHTHALATGEQPFLLKLPNLFHLATDVEGELTDGDSSLDLVGALHPTAAVAGTPTSAAIAAIRELEPFDRGRYAGPVG